MPTETIYEHYFSTFEKMLDYISDGCCMDCYCCAWPSSIPCNHKFTDLSKDEIKEWLLSEYKEEE